MSNWKSLARTALTALALALAASLAACQTQPQATGNEPSSGGAAAEPGGVVTYDMFFNRGEANYPEDGGEGRSLISDKLAQAGITGFDYKVTLASGDEYFTKLNLLASSGDLPDYFAVDLTTMTKFAEEGLIRPIDDLLPQMPNAHSMFRDIDLAAGTVDGKPYGFPNAYRPEPINGPAGGFVIRQDWLDKLGLTMPETLDELHDVLLAFTQDDPDGNGADDTFGLGGSRPENSAATGGFDGIFGAFGIHPTYWHERDGRLKQGMALPEMKQALEVLRQWFEEGIIDPEFVVATGKQLDEKVINSKVGVWSGAVWPLDPGSPIYRSLQQAVPEFELKMLPTPVGPDGERGWPAGGTATSFYVISAEAENPDLLAKVLDWAASGKPEGGHMLITYGVEGQDYTFDPETNRIRTISSADDLGKIGLSNPVQFINVVDRRWASDPVLEGLQVTGEHTFLNEFSNVVPAMLEYPDINKLWIEYFVKIVTGVYPVDAWDEFLSKYEQQGGRAIEDQVNEAWNQAQ